MALWWSTCPSCSGHCSRKSEPQTCRSWCVRAVELVATEATKHAGCTRTHAVCLLFAHDPPPSPHTRSRGPRLHPCTTPLGPSDSLVQAMPAAKQAYMTKDLSDWTKVADTPFKFTSTFPLRTVLPLRVSIVVGGSRGWWFVSGARGMGHRLSGHHCPGVHTALAVVPSLKAGLGGVGNVWGHVLHSTCLGLFCGELVSQFETLLLLQLTVLCLVCASTCVR